MSAAILVSGSASYSWQAKIKAMSAEEFTAFRARLPSERLPENQEEAGRAWLGECIMDGEEIEVWNSIGVSVDVRKIKGLHYPSPPSTLPRAVQDAAGAAAGGAAPVVVQVSVAGVGLLMMQRVEWLEDCCTMELQKVLDAGWRILAVCPPNDARRPTYIIGHAERNAEMP